MRLFVDMDGTLNVFRNINTFELLMEENYFASLTPQTTVIDAVKNILRNNKDVEVYVLSAVLSDHKTALKEKNEWLDKYLPEIDAEHRIFPPCGKDKKDYVPGGIREDDCLLDDYSKNLCLWCPPGRGIKLLNGVNGKNEKWGLSRLSLGKSGMQLANDIVKIMSGDIIKDKNPRDFYHASGTVTEKDIVPLAVLGASEHDSVFQCFVRGVVLNEEKDMLFRYDRETGCESIMIDGVDYGRDKDICHLFEHFCSKKMRETAQLPERE